MVTPFCSFNYTQCVNKNQYKYSQKVIDNRSRIEMCIRDRDLKGAERIPVTAIRRRCDNRPVKADADMEDLIGKALNQNFVPVLDDQKSFIGIITRKDIIKYFYQKCETAEERSKKCQDQGGKEHKKTDLSAVVKLRSQEGVLV